MRHHLKIAGKAAVVQVSSAGTRGSNPGAKPDPRVERVLSSHGVDLGRIRARRLNQKNLQKSDYVFAMDRQNLQSILEICPVEDQHKVSLLLSHIEKERRDEVPDPYFGSLRGFEGVFNLIDGAVSSLLVQGFIPD